MNETIATLIVLGFMVLIFVLTLVWLDYHQRKIKERAKRLEKEMKRINDRIGRIIDGK